MSRVKGRPTLTAFQARAIRYQYHLQAMGPSKIGEYWGISKFTVVQICNGRLHKDGYEKDMETIRAAHAKVQQIVDDAYEEWARDLDTSGYIDLERGGGQ